MALTLTIGDQAETINTGDLADAHALQASTLTLASDVFNAVILGGPISGLSDDFLEGDLSASTKQQWKQTIDSATSITFGVNPGAECSVIVRKAGTVFPSFPSDIKDDPVTKTINVPEGKGYVSIVFSVSLEVTAQGKFTSGNFGVSTGIDAQDTFKLANHFVFDQATPVRDAILDAFGRFELPFGPFVPTLTDTTHPHGLNPGDIVESEFIGSLALTATLTEGFSGALLGAFGPGGLSLSAKSPLGGVLATANPTFNLGLTFEVDYTHTDAFRMVVLVQSGELELLYFKRKTDDLKTTIGASAALNPGINIDFTNQLPGLLNTAAQKLTAGAPPTVAQDFTQGISQLVSTATQPLTDATNELNSVVPSLMKKLPSLSVAASASFESVTENTVFGDFVFSPLPINAAAWRLAMSGDLQSAMHQPGVQLGAGSYIEKSLTDSTTLSFAFFGLRAQSVQQYFKDVTLTYAGSGQFQYRLKTGIDATSDVFGRQREADLYFLVDANLAAGGNVSGESVTLFIVRKDQNAGDHSFGLGKTISLMLPSGGSAIAQLLNDATRNNPQIPIALTAQFAASAFKKIQATPFVGGKPQPLANQIQDKNNFQIYTQALDDVVVKNGNGFPDEVNDYGIWAQVNDNLIGLPGGPPDRRQTGALSNPIQAFGNVDSFTVNFDSGTLTIFLNYLEEARRFMNLCDDLQQLAALAGDPDTSQQFKDLVDMATQIVKADVTAFPLDFLNAILLALVRIMGAVPTSISAPASSDLKSFAVTISYA